MAPLHLPDSESVRVRASGKINLGLKVGPVREDGYHPLANVFQAVSIFDELQAQWAPPGEVRISIAGEQAHLVPADERNLAVRAARLLVSEFGDPAVHGVSLALRKAIPVTGGMAGGSADAAAALLACSVLWDLDTSPDELRDLGAMLGADVPFSLLGGTALGTGRGDRLAPVLSRGTYHWVLAFGDGELSTPEVFGRFDELNPGLNAEPEVPRAVMNALVSGDPAALGRALSNDLQPAALSLRPGLAQVLEVGVELGALAGLVSGSGPTCAFLAANEAAAIDLSVKLSSEGLCRAIRRVTGPVPGARIIT
ncbi:MAG: 4-(cytidine 5'-diphospho)-2-C-methyl-D-erythritol kinase [Micropruina sp.]|nr:4-(cytidine 5'-diphospho)-2-C-methyl-D-erythritol kinase [Micropruina sp.]